MKHTPDPKCLHFESLFLQGLTAYRNISFFSWQPWFYVLSGVFSFFFLIFILFFFKCYSLTTHGREDGRTVGGVFVETQVPKINTECHCPSRSSINPHPVPCLIMLLCVCSWFCISWVKECVFLRSLCQCVCSSNTGFSPYYSPPPPFFSLSTFDGYTPTPLLLPNQTLFFFYHYFELLTFSCTPPVLLLANS